MVYYIEVALFIGNKFYKKFIGAFPLDHNPENIDIIFEPKSINRNGKEYFFQFKKTNKFYNGLQIFKFFSICKGNPYEYDDIANKIKGSIY